MEAGRNKLEHTTEEKKYVDIKRGNGLHHFMNAS